MENVGIRLLLHSVGQFNSLRRNEFAHFVLILLPKDDGVVFLQVRIIFPLLSRSAMPSVTSRFSMRFEGFTTSTVPCRCRWIPPPAPEHVSTLVAECSGIFTEAYIPGTSSNSHSGLGLRCAWCGFACRFGRRSARFARRTILRSGDIDIHVVSHVNIGDRPFRHRNHEAQKVVLRKVAQRQVTLVRRSSRRKQRAGVGVDLRDHAVEGRGDARISRTEPDLFRARLSRRALLARRPTPNPSRRKRPRWLPDPFPVLRRFPLAPPAPAEAFARRPAACRSGARRCRRIPRD